ncbi:MAG: hypothetical protein U0T83_01355 [Bacteriovoracaceae bacterium]
MHFFISVVTYLFISAVYSDSLIRWTASEDSNASFDHVLSLLSQKTGSKLEKDSFILQEDRKLAYSNYKRYDQVFEEIPIVGKSIRIWTDLQTGKTIQIEAYLQTNNERAASEAYLKRIREKSTLASNRLSEKSIAEIARTYVKRTPSDAVVNSLSSSEQWDNGRLYRFVVVKAKRGTHYIKISLETSRVVNYRYVEYPRGDLPSDPSDLSVLAKVYPIYEEMENDRTIFSREDRVLKYIKAKIPLINNDPFISLKNRTYMAELNDNLMSEMNLVGTMGYWSLDKIKKQANTILRKLPMVDNSWKNGVVLDGRFAKITLHPAAVEKFKKDLDFEPRYADLFIPFWKINRGVEMVPSTAFYGKPLFSAEEAYNRVARRLDDHDPVSYINDGFDDIQVYYAINTLFESLIPRGFTDPELSTRPFTAVLYDPDIGSRDNAYYTDDKIYFTTYSPTSQNLARDNTTIWHELGHGIMDRIMGNKLVLEGTGGLSEGMADFIAHIIITAETKGKRFKGDNLLRIVNNTHFGMTNEIHDDGEAYGGMLKDILDQAISKFGFSLGLNKVTDLVLESMRLTRDHPALSAVIWTEHLLFVDSLGRKGLREPSELKEIILKVIKGRNLRLDGVAGAKFHLINKIDNQEVENSANGTRNSPIDVGYLGKKTKTFKIHIELSESDVFKFNFPITLRVQYQGGPLQGPIHFKDEESADFKKVQSYVFKSLKEASIDIPVTVTGTCDYINSADNSCSDYVYFQILNEQDGKGVIAKKRFYISVQN